jgi:hypothetical protein
VEILGHLAARCEFFHLPSPFLPPPPFLPLPSVARWQKFRPKSSKGAAEIKICGRILADFTKNRQKKGPQKIFKRSSLFLAVITTYNIHQDKIKFDF